MVHFLVFEHFYRMCDNDSQLGRVPSESSLDNRHTDTDINQLLTIGAMNTIQPLLEATIASTKRRTTSLLSYETLPFPSVIPYFSSRSPLPTSQMHHFISAQIEHHLTASIGLFSGCESQISKFQYIANLEKENQSSAGRNQCLSLTPHHQQGLIAFAGRSGREGSGC